MPVYEFACRDCQKTFEIVRPMSESSANVTCCAYQKRGTRCLD